MVICFSTFVRILSLTVYVFRFIVSKSKNDARLVFELTLEMEQDSTDKILSPVSIVRSGFLTLNAFKY